MKYAVKCCRSGGDADWDELRLLSKFWRHLDDVALALGLPGKIGGHGSEVEGEGDCLNLFVLYVRWALLSGRIDPAGHNASLQSLIECLESERDARSHFGTIPDRWRATTRPMPRFVPCAWR